MDTINTVVTNVPGPRVPLYCLGRRMVDALPFIMLGTRIRIAMAIYSYLDSLTYAITGDYDSCPDIDVLARGIEEGMDELVKAAR